MIPRKQLIDPALLVAVDDGSKCACQVGLRFDSVEFAGLDAPCCTRQGKRTDAALHRWSGLPERLIADTAYGIGPMLDWQTEALERRMYGSDEYNSKDRRRLELQKSMATYGLKIIDKETERRFKYMHITGLLE